MDEPPQGQQNRLSAASAATRLAWKRGSRSTHRDREVAEAIAGQLTKAGLLTTLRIDEGVSWLNNVMYVPHKAGPVYLSGWGAGGRYDAEGVYDPLFQSGKMLTNYYNADVDALNDEAKQSMEPKWRFGAVPHQPHRCRRRGGHAALPAD